jgi:D-alanine-D-alanine ligase
MPENTAPAPASSPADPDTTARTSSETTRDAAKIRVALVFGGRSAEHEVSCATAASVLEALDRDRYDVIPVGIARDGHWVLAPDDADQFRLTSGHRPSVDTRGASVIVPTSATDKRLVIHEAGQPPRDLGEVDVVFPLLHGPFGEDGTIQGMLDLADVRYVGSGVTASATMMDKAAMKVVFTSAGLPVGPYAVITDREWRRDPEAAKAKTAGLEYPLFVKPARAGSSFGITRVTSPDQLDAAIETAREFDPKVVIEQGIFGREIECGVLDGRGSELPRASVLGECRVVANHDFYDFDAKYLHAEDVVLQTPAEVPEEVAERIRELSVRAFLAAGCEGLARVDFFLTEAGDILINEINTMPGFTPTSMYPRMWAASGIGYAALIDELISLAMQRRLGLR